MFRGDRLTTWYMVITPRNSKLISYGGTIKKTSFWLWWPSLKLSFREGIYARFRQGTSWFPPVRQVSAREHHLTSVTLSWSFLPTRYHPRQVKEWDLLKKGPESQKEVNHPPLISRSNRFLWKLSLPPALHSKTCPRLWRNSSSMAFLFSALALGAKAGQKYVEHVNIVEHRFEWLQHLDVPGR